MAKKAKARAKPARRAPVKRAKPVRRAKPVAKRSTRSAKRAAKPAAKKGAPASRIVQPLAIGRVAHYFTHISVAVIELTGPLKEGDRIRIVGATTNFDQPVKSLQIEHRVVAAAAAGDAIGLKVRDRARQGDVVYRL